MSRFLRFYCPSLPSSLGDIAPLESDEAHHLVKVLRVSVGNQVTLFDGRGSRANATVKVIRQGIVECELVEAAYQTTKGVSIEIALAPPKRDFDETLTMLAELGVTRVILLDADYGEVLKGMNQDRFRRFSSRIKKTLVAASKQSGNDILLTVCGPQKLNSDIEDMILCDPNASHSLLDREKGPSSKPIAIGPEGGWSERELSVCTARNWEFVRLPGHVLRTGTAAVVAAVVAQLSLAR